MNWCLPDVLALQASYKGAATIAVTALEQACTDSCSLYLDTAHRGLARLASEPQRVPRCHFQPRHRAAPPGLVSGGLIAAGEGARGLVMSVDL